MDSDQKKSSIVVTILALMFFSCVYVSYNQGQAKNDIDNIKVDPTVLMINPGESNISVKELEVIVMKMPNSALKSCLLTCIGAAYGGDIDQLHAIMKEFARLKILELKTKNQI